ncbi:hypothetical protein DL771_002504 [Monosporascus sp. 5C6A]|nr:hypothetical protein DL771_002504 [Monosporascus sp. 5C6A]
MGDAKLISADMRDHGETWKHRFGWTHQIRSPIYQAFFKPGGRPWVILADPREIEDITARRDKEFDKDKTRGTNTFAVIAPKATITQALTPEFKAQRKQWLDTMRPEFLHRVVVPYIGTAASELVELWNQKVSKAATSPIDVHHDFSVAALDTIWVAILGERLGLTQAKIDEFKQKGEMSMSKIGHGIDMGATMDFINTLVQNYRTSIFTWYARWKLQRDSEYQKFRQIKDEAINRLIRKSVARFERILDGNIEGEEYDSCAMDMVLRRRLLAAQKAGQPAPDPTRDRALCDELFLLLWAGHDTTSITLSWFVKYMSNNINVQDKLREAVKKALPGESIPSAAEIVNADIPYLDGAMEETLRLTGTAPVIVRDAKIDTEILGHKVPKGTYVLMNTSIRDRPEPVPEELRSPSSRAARERRGYDWANEPCAENLHEFAPERWLKKDMNGLEVFDSKTLPQNAFGDGARACFGKRLAYLELRIMIAHMIWHFKFLPLPEGYNSMRANEGMLRKAAQCYVRLQPV